MSDQILPVSIKSMIMKKVHIILVIAYSIFGLTACNEYRSMTTASKVSDLGGNPFYRTLSKSVLKNIDGFIKTQDQKKSIGIINFQTSMKTFLTTTSQWNTFRDKMGEFYHIADRPLSQQFGSLTTVKDLILFTARYGTKFPPCY